MSKRFTDTEKWRDPWFCSLTPPEKLFWVYLLDTCNMAGVWQVNWPLVSFYIPGFEFKDEVFAGRIEKLKNDKWYVKKFTDFQYGPLHTANRMHQRIAFELEKEGVSTPLKYPSQGVKDKELVKESLPLLLEKRGAGEKNNFEIFWQSYPKKRSKGAALRAWRKLDPPAELVSRILAALTRAKTSEGWVKDGGQFIPHPATWLNAMGWEDDYTEAPSNARKPRSYLDNLMDKELRENHGRSDVGEVPSMFRRVDKTTPV